jgi:predicted small lipoprotein YifL
MRSRTPLLLILALALALPLAACGRKGPPDPPDGVDPKYPRGYPAGSPPPTGTQ